MIYYVYQLETLEGQVFYIGKGTMKKNYNRVDFYKYWEFTEKVNRHLYNKINKLNGKFIVNIIKYFKKEKDSLLFEQQLIKEIGLENLCNITQGGEGWSFNHSEKTKQKLSKLKTGVPLSKKHCESITNGKLKQKNKLDDFYEEIVEHYKTKNTSQISKIYQVHQTTIINFLKKHNIFIPYKNLTPMTEEHKNNISKNKTRKLKN